MKSGEIDASVAKQLLGEIPNNDESASGEDPTKVDSKEPADSKKRPHADVEDSVDQSELDGLIDQAKKAKLESWTNSWTNKTYTMDLWFVVSVFC